MPQVEVAVVGLGYVGCVTAACLADIGCRVIGIDKDQNKVDNVISGRAPFYEPGLEEVVQRAVKSGNLTASTSLVDVARTADVALICVGTPSEKNGNLDLSQLRRVVAELANNLGERTKQLIVAIRSTVFPGTCEEVVMPAFAGNRWVTVVSNPEFLREGIAMKDFVEPSLIVIGGDDAASVKKVADLYAPLGVEPCLVSLRTAEMIKYSCNAFHAVKIAFANEVGALAERLGVDPQEVMGTLVKDVKLNSSAAYLKPGFAFGGSCLPKDLRALTYRGSRLDLRLPLLESALPSNQSHLDRAVAQILDLPAKKIGVVGLAFKENTDDLRESPVVTLLETLIGKGKDVRVYDPHIQLENIYGANRAFIETAIPHIGRLLQPDLKSVLGWADHVIVAQKQSKENAEQIRQSGHPVIDLVGTGLTHLPVAVAGGR